MNSSPAHVWVIPQAVCWIGCADSEAMLHQAIQFAVQRLNPFKNGFAGGVVYYTLQQIRTGRRLTGSIPIPASNHAIQGLSPATPWFICHATQSEFFVLPSAQAGEGKTSSVVRIPPLVEEPQPLTVINPPVWSPFLPQFLRMDILLEVRNTPALINRLVPHHR